MSSSNKEGRDRGIDGWREGGRAQLIPVSGYFLSPTSETDLLSFASSPCVTPGTDLFASPPFCALDLLVIWCDSHGSCLTSAALAVALHPGSLLAASPRDHLGTSPRDV